MPKKVLFDIPSLNEKYFPKRFAITEKGQVFQYFRATFDERKVVTKKLERKRGKAIKDKAFVSIAGQPCQVHHLMAEVFLDPPEEGQTRVLFKNQRVADLRIDNLYWATVKEAYRYAKSPSKAMILTHKKKKRIRDKRARRKAYFFLRVRRAMIKRIYKKISAKLDFKRKGSLLLYEILTYRKTLKQLSIEEGCTTQVIKSKIKKECRRLGIDYELIKQLYGLLRVEGYRKIEKDVTFNESL